MFKLLLMHCWAYQLKVRKGENPLSFYISSYFYTYCTFGKSIKDIDESDLIAHHEADQLRNTKKGIER